jgi:hypothetical protein
MLDGQEHKASGRSGYWLRFPCGCTLPLVSINLLCKEEIMSAILERHSLVRKPADQPDETRPFLDGKGKMQIYELGDHIVGKGEFEPGWKWSQHVKPIAGTDSCKAAHTGLILQGRMVVQMDDGSQVEYGPNDFFYMPPGHDAWIVGNERCVVIDVTGVAKYAKPH